MSVSVSVAVEVEEVTGKVVRALDDNPVTTSTAATATADGATATGALVGAPTDTDTAP
jgi:hypothetical protein